MERVLPNVIDKNYSVKKISMGKAETKDGQVLYAVNDLFVGINNHTSARYHICYNNRVENQSSSGVIISTGLGMTGWHKSVMAEFRGMAKAFNLPEVQDKKFEWDNSELVFQVREPYPSRFTQAELVYGKVQTKDTLTFTSLMSEDGIVFSDGIQEDAIKFDAGMEIKISVAERVGRLVAE
jgi:hypothetical protein